MARVNAEKKASEMLGPVIMNAVESAGLKFVYQAEYKNLVHAARHETDKGVLAILRRYGIDVEGGETDGEEVTEKEGAKRRA